MQYHCNFIPSSQNSTVAYRWEASAAQTPSLPPPHLQSPTKTCHSQDQCRCCNNNDDSVPSLVSTSRRLRRRVRLPVLLASVEERPLIAVLRLRPDKAVAPERRDASAPALSPSLFAGTTHREANKHIE